ncbi:MAG: STAS domain-containing protein [Deltaproteobacteria bacterium]|nr:STAS domain-containing protein [Deltaproteobacteria bacterium]
MSQLEIRLETVEGKVPVTVIHVTGDIDASSHQNLDAKAEEVINGGAKHVVLDLTANTYMSSAGFRSMHKIYTALKGKGEGAGVNLLNPNDEVKRLMKAMGFEAFFPTFSDLKEAVEAF